MKGWVKGMLIGAAACVGAGSMVCAGAWAMGGRFSHYRHRSYGLTEQWTEGEDMDTWEEDLEEPAVYEEDQDIRQGSGDREAWEGGKTGGGIAKEDDGREARSGGTIVRELEIEVMGGWVEVAADDSVDQIVVTSSNENYACRQELKEDKLEVSIGLNSGLWQDWLSGRDDGDFGDEDLAARILIPGGAVFREVGLTVKGGGLHMDQVTAQKLELDLGAGILEVSAGNVQELEGQCKAGELVYQGQVGQEMEAECATGSIQYQIDGSPEDFWYEVESAAGSVVVDGEEKGGLNWKKENTVDNPGAVKKAKLECKAGAVNVEFQ